MVSYSGIGTEKTMTALFRVDSTQQVKRGGGVQRNMVVEDTGNKRGKRGLISWPGELSHAKGEAKKNKNKKINLEFPLWSSRKESD